MGLGTWRAEACPGKYTGDVTFVPRGEFGRLACCLAGWLADYCPCKWEVLYFTLSTTNLLHSPAGGWGGDGWISHAPLQVSR